MGYSIYTDPIVSMTGHKFVIHKSYINPFEIIHFFVVIFQGSEWCCGNKYIISVLRLCSTLKQTYFIWSYQHTTFCDLSLAHVRDN